jgi:histidinol-phosphate phosphatase family protein
VLLIDDRRDRSGPLLAHGPPAPVAGLVEVLAGRAAGPAAARNAGWQASEADWVAFLDDDVVPDRDWLELLAEDLEGVDAGVGASQGSVRVPLPAGRRPTDWERNLAALEGARWTTADMACPRAALAAVGGFDERFERAYREDSDLGLRLERAALSVVQGRRSVTHPVPRAGPLASLRAQAGNADDALMDALHGRGWRERAGAPAGRRPRHLATTAAGALSLGGLLAGRRRVAAMGAAGWLAGTGELAWARIAPGPRSADEVATMLLTSAVMPLVATGFWLRGLARRRRLLQDEVRAPRPKAEVPGAPRGEATEDGPLTRAVPPTAAAPQAAPPPARPPRGGPRGFPVPPDAVLFDRDGTLVVDVPYNGDPDRVETMPGARESVDRLRAAGVPLAVVSNQSGVARGWLSLEQVEAVNRRAEDLLGPLGPALVCPHGPDDRCDCRKPAPGLLLRAAEALGVEPARCAVIGDIGADLEAARAAGARAVLVPNQRTLPAEIEAAEEVAPSLHAAVDLLLGEGAEEVRSTAVDGTPDGSEAGAERGLA